MKAVFSCEVSAPWIPGFSQGSSNDIPPPKPEQVSREDLDQESMHDTITHYNTTFHMHQQDAYASDYKLIYTAHI